MGDAILTMDNLQQRNRIIVNACPMCLGGEESVDNLLLNCKAEHIIWKSIMGWLGFPLSCRPPSITLKGVEDSYNFPEREDYVQDHLLCGYLVHLEREECAMFF